MLKLYFCDVCLGNIGEVGVDGMWFSAHFTPSEQAHEFKDFFDAMVDQEQNYKISSFDKELLNEHNWLLIDDILGKKTPISLPAIHYIDELIMWRRR